MARSVREPISSTSTSLSWFPRSNGSCPSWPISPGLAHQGRENLDRAHVDHDHLILTTFPLKLISRDLEASRHAPPFSPTTLGYIIIFSYGLRRSLLPWLSKRLPQKLKDTWTPNKALINRPPRPPYLPLDFLISENSTQSRPTVPIAQSHYRMPLLFMYQ